MNSYTIPATQALQKGVYTAIQMFLSNDKLLLELGANDRAIAYKLAEYLQSVFRDWDVDCQYDKDGHELVAKSIQLPFDQVPQEVREALVYPDIIVHRRGSDQNLLVIGVNKSTNSDEKFKRFNRNKVDTYFSSSLRYKLGLYLTFDTDGTLGQPYLVEWYMGPLASNGQIA